MSGQTPGAAEYRRLDFRTPAEAMAEIDRLAAEGYRALGRWDLGQICRHLSYYTRGALDGFSGPKLPAPLRWVARKLMLPRALKSRQMAKNLRTLPTSVYPPGGDASEAIEELRSLFRRLDEETGAVHPSPLFGTLTRDQWRELHLIHASHHLGFLIPIREV